MAVNGLCDIKLCGSNTV